MLCRTTKRYSHASQTIAVPHTLRGLGRLAGLTTLLTDHAAWEICAALWTGQMVDDGNGRESIGWMIGFESRREVIGSQSGSIGLLSRTSRAPAKVGSWML